VGQPGVSLFAYLIWASPAWTACNLRCRGNSTEPADIRSEVDLSVALAHRVVAAGDPPRSVGQVPAESWTTLPACRECLGRV